ncbi:Zn2/Cys6 DNA-binding protein [Glarea lozoyensis ATCC 20868]|uniref:Zn2/Cys6 DNA-binding protein n=1 Tax=Glarea lozoyensis (strain ATCC 20868 / MF5171) TaxID=1116229 RepID=S3CNP5_GLAL2|nr:Zn2/Cys6 DNA-binding protein [Glarea lozoyensis ATCC 20868]EPE26774.1 Zn2/Cys6 DNA-binding protein [Glarea lozoyensis ATCC 20868]
MGRPLKTPNACWSCRLRRKKCDEKQPVCDTCATLYITCYHDVKKPEWMDGAKRQEEMMERLKREVKENAYLRRGQRAVRTTASTTPGSEPEVMFPQQALPTTNPILQVAQVASSRCSLIPPPQFQRGTDCTRITKDARNIDFGRSDTILFMFYLEDVFPFLFPFYRPSLLEGGRAWILEMMISSPVVRQAILCQSSYFFSLARGTETSDVVWETVLTQTRDTLGMLRQSLQVIESSEITEHLHGAVRIMASIMQVQRFDIAVLSFENCQTHLNAALALFKRLFEGFDPAVEPSRSDSTFYTVMSRLGPPSEIQCVQIPSAEQAAFSFSSALLILDDIMASTVLQEQPRLYEYHGSLLNSIDGAEPPINLEHVIGCQNWVLLQIGETAVLDAWKQQCKRAGNLDVMQLVHRATIIKDTLEANLSRLESDLAAPPRYGGSLFDLFKAEYCLPTANQSSLVTRVWAHAALIYLFVVVSGWQPSSVDIRYHVGQIIELLSSQTSSPGLLRTMAWPFCVAGCLAESAQEDHLRVMVQALHPPSIFGTVRKALEIMENVWRNRNSGDIASRDLALCFQNQGRTDLVLLV